MKRRKSIKSDLARIDRMKDADIDYSDIPRLDKTFLKKATTARPPAKKQSTIRLDEDALDWLKRHGKGYQTRINRILRVVMESQPPRSAHRWASAIGPTQANTRLEWATRQRISRSSSL
jgi:uncharacterized protein (DUF4415 family)